MQQTLLIIDGNAIMHRAYHAIPPFKTSDGTPTNVVYGFLSMLNKVINDFKPDNIITCFDTPKPTFRNELLKEYQAQRPKIEDDFIVQIPLVKKALDEAGIYHLEKDGFEADDLIGTISSVFKENNYRVLILSGDKDIMQLVDESVFLASPLLGLSNIKIYDEVEVERKLFVKPKQIPDYKALAGDPSDNYKGAPGIGPKTAVKLLEKYRTVEAVLNNVDSIESEKVRNIIKDNKESVIVSKKLATILRHVELTIDIKKSEFSHFNQNLKLFLEKYQMNSLLKRMFNQVETAKKEPLKKQSNQIGLF